MAKKLEVNYPVGFVSVNVNHLLKAHWNYKTDDNVKADKLKNNILRNGQIENIIIRQLESGFYEVVNGNHRYDVLCELKQQEIMAYNLGFISDSQAKRIAIETNETRFESDNDKLASLIQEITKDFDLSDLQNTMPFNNLEWENFNIDFNISPNFEINENDNQINENDNINRAGNLFKKFVIPPFSVLDTRQGYWQDRKKQWISLGIKSELGRDNVQNSLGSAFKLKVMAGSNQTAKKDEIDVPNWAVTSIFDPVLCELMYKWFNVENGSILDPFAGGSVRGIVAGYLGYEYHGIDLRGEQIEANNINAKDVINLYSLNNEFKDPEALSPVEKRDDIYFKREDLLNLFGVNGSKVRACFQLAKNTKKTGLVTAGSRSSPQVNIVAHIAKGLGLECYIHTPEGELSPEVVEAVNLGAKLTQHKAGYNNVIISRANKQAKELDLLNIPFGMECIESINIIRKQVSNIPKDISRIVVPVGSGMNLAGILHGLNDLNFKIPVLGVIVGKDPTEILNKYAPKNWNNMVKLVKSDLDYHDEYPNPFFLGISLDPVYEAKCIPFVKPNDLFWLVGIRKTAKEYNVFPKWYIGNSINLDKITNNQKFDYVFSCPPYFDLEVYSDNPEDLSTMDWGSFEKEYTLIINKAVKQLKDDRFACFVVGDVRDKKGFYYNFVDLTKKAFIDAGALFYNELILVNVAGTLPVRVGKSFGGYRKVGKMLQNVLVFYKGDPKKIKENFQEIKLTDLDIEILE